jgi:RNA polymerase sigma-70 factor (ECF subfamily)
MSPMSEPDEPSRDAVRQLIEGRNAEESFRRVFQQYHGAVFGFFFRKGFSNEDCRDLTQEVFVAVYTSLESLRSAAAFPAWLFSIARHVFFHRLERQTKSLQIATTRGEGSAAGKRDAAGSIASQEPDPLRRLLDQEVVDGMRDALEELPPRVQDCIRARLVDGLTHREIGDRLGISENTVAVHVHRGLKSLRKQLRPVSGKGRFGWNV